MKLEIFILCIFLDFAGLTCELDLRISIERLLVTYSYKNASYGCRLTAVRLRFTGIYTESVFIRPRDRVPSRWDLTVCDVQ
eukprot:SAG22_NODE_458_length_10257_cov_4.533373_5_plen_81_part_00